MGTLHKYAPIRLTSELDCTGTSMWVSYQRPQFHEDSYSKKTGSRAYLPTKNTYFGESTNAAKTGKFLHSQTVLSGANMCTG